MRVLWVGCAPQAARGSELAAGGPAGEARGSGGGAPGLPYLLVVLRTLLFTVVSLQVSTLVCSVWLSRLGSLVVMCCLRCVRCVYRTFYCSMHAIVDYALLRHSTLLAR